MLEYAALVASPRAFPDGLVLYFKTLLIFDILTIQPLFYNRRQRRFQVFRRQDDDMGCPGLENVSNGLIAANPEGDDK